VRRTRWARGGRTATLLGALAVLLAGCSASDWERNLRFGWPTGVTSQATRMRVLWTWAGVTALALGVIVWGLIFWAIIRYRRRGRPNDYIPRQTKYNLIIEVICVTFPFIVIAGLFYRTVVVEDYVNRLTANPDVVVQVDAFKWNWQFEYHTYRGPQGLQTQKPQVLAYTDPANPTKQLTDPADVNSPLYLSTVGSQDEIPILVIPVDQSVQIVEHSYDVIHSFWVPEFLFKRDVIPYGTLSSTHDNRFEITPTVKGSYVGRCAELCGVYHSQMNFEVRVVAQKTFAAYLAALKRIGPDDPARQAKALQIAMPGKSPYATTTYPLDTDRTARKASQRPGG
jgi:cytochrome c oxidase subunit 2